MRLIVYSLFGDSPKYLHGAVVNAQQAPTFYPGWVCVFFVDNLFSPTADQLRALGAVVSLPVRSDIGSIYWRHCIADCSCNNLDAYIVRDTDSRFTEREVAAVKAWVESGKTFHHMRDHPSHSHPIMQGMYGVRGSALKGISEKFVGFPNIRSGADEVFKAIYEGKMKDDILEHGEFYLEQFPNQVPFPTCRDGYRFVGEIFDEHDQPTEDWKAFCPTLPSG